MSPGRLTGLPDRNRRSRYPKLRSSRRAIAPERYKVQLTVSRETHDKLRHVQDLMRHSNPTGDLSLILGRALTLLLTELSKAKCGAAERPRPVRTARTRSRHIRAAVKRAVWTRDGGRCAFQAERRRCTETGFLDFHHVVPYADGGELSVGNIQLRCRAHNQHEANLWSGEFRALHVRETRTEFST